MWTSLFKMKYRSKWTRFDILKFIDEYHPDISFKIMGMDKRSKAMPIGGFAHNKYGRLFVNKIFFSNRQKYITVFKVENAWNRMDVNHNKVIKAYMNEWVKKTLKNVK